MGFSAHTEKKMVNMSLSQTRQGKYHLWSPSEIEKMVTEYATKGPTQLALELGLDKTAVYNKAGDLGLIFENHWWTEEEANQIIKEYPTKTAPELAKQFGVDQKAIYYVVSRRRLGWAIPKVRKQIKHKTKGTYERRWWFESEIEKLKAEYATKGPSQLAKELNRKRKTVIYKAHRLGLSFESHWWTKEEISKVQKEYAHKSAAQLAKELGVSRVAVYGLAHAKLGLHRLIPKRPKKVVSREWQRRVFGKWSQIRASHADHERIGKQWLFNNGFTYVYAFAEHLNYKSTEGYYRKNFAFDYYAEKDGDRWFIDATTSFSRRLDHALLDVFLRFSRIGILFVGKTESYLLEITRPQRTVKVTNPIMTAMSVHMPKEGFGELFQ